MRVDLDPLRTVHLGATQQVTGLARADHDLALVCEPVARMESALPVHQGQPYTASIGVEAGYVKRPVVQQIPIGCKAAGLDGVTADELVDVLKAGILTHVHHRTATLGHGHGGPLVCSPSQGRALDRRMAGVHRINLYHPAKAVDFVGVLGGIEPYVMFMPAIACGIAFAKPPAPLVGIGLIRTVEVADEVLLAGEVGAPGRLAAAAVVDGSQHPTATRIGRGLHQGVACSWPADRCRGSGGDSTGPRRGSYNGPLATPCGHFANTDPVGCLGLSNLLSAPVALAITVEQAIVHVLMVHHQEAGLGALDCVVVNAIMVHAELCFLFGGGVGRIGLESR